MKILLHEVTWTWRRGKQNQLHLLVAESAFHIVICVMRVAYFTPMNRTRKTHFNESYVGLVYVPKMHCLQDIGHCDQCSDYIFNLRSWTQITKNICALYVAIISYLQT